MAIIGAYGDKLAFSVSRDTVLTFHDFARDISARYGTHEVVGNRPRLEFLGPQLQELSFSMELYLGLGADPLETINLLGNLAESGYHGRLVIGNEQVGQNEWVIQKVGEKREYITDKGELLYATVSVTMKEYR